MKYTFLFILLLFTFTLKSQTNSILSGKILDEKNLPIANAKIQIIYMPWNTTKNITTNKKGFYTASNLQPGGPYIVKVSYNEYEEQTRELSSLDLGDNNLSLHMRQIKIQIVDSETTESLAGVKNGNKYSDLDGFLVVNKNTPISLELISYEKINIIAKNDTIIKMSSVK